MPTEPVKGAAVIFAAMLLAGCTNISQQAAFPRPGQAELANEQAFQEDALLTDLRDEDRRVATIGFRLATANVELCSDKAPQPGVVLTSALQYRPRLRPVARRALSISDMPTVEVVVAGAPAQAAGLREGDVLVSIDGEPVQPPKPGADQDPASFSVVQATNAQLRAALEKGPARLTVQHDGASRVVTLSAPAACAYDVEVLPSKDVNAGADGRRVFITTGLIRYAVTDDALAVVVGHEYAHDVLHHRQRLDRHGFARALLGELGSTPASLITAEKEADYVGLYLAARAGYDISAAPQFWRRLAADYGDAWYVRWSHPGSLERAAALEAARAEIEQKIKAGAPLVPNPVR